MDDFDRDVRLPWASKSVWTLVPSWGEIFESGSGKSWVFSAFDLAGEARRLGRGWANFMTTGDALRTVAARRPFFSRLRHHQATHREVRSGEPWIVSIINGFGSWLTPRDACLGVCRRLKRRVRTFKLELGRIHARATDRDRPKAAFPAALDRIPIPQC
jgi:hypothetical protein